MHWCSLPHLLPLVHNELLESDSTRRNCSATNHLVEIANVSVKSEGLSIRYPLCVGIIFSLLSLSLATLHIVRCLSFSPHRAYLL